MENILSPSLSWGAAGGGIGKCSIQYVYCCLELGPFNSKLSLSSH